MSDRIENIGFSTLQRSARIEQLKNEQFDLLIVGAGITGAGIARDATLRGFKVAIVDKNDFAFGTSSRSSKMAHGGFRYLKSFEFGLVKESETERNWLRYDYPNLVRPLPMLAPSYEGEKYTPGLLKFAVFLYNMLDKGKKYKKFKFINDIETIKSMEPAMKVEGLKGAGLIYDTNIDDARLTVETIKEAVATGRCTALNYVKVTGLELDPATGKGTGVRALDVEGPSAAEFPIKAYVVVNATGIWTDELLTKKPEGYPEKVIRPTKGVHVIFKKEDVPINNASGIVSHVDGRFFFVLSRENFVVIGTTDTDFKDNFDEPVCTKEDAEYLLSTVRIKFPGTNPGLDKVVGTYAGVRPLASPRAKKGKPVSESAVSRDHEIIVSEEDLVSICGGKLTTFRVMAEDLMRNHVKPLVESKLLDRRFTWQKDIARRRYQIAMEKDEWETHPAVKDTLDAKKLDREQLDHLHRQYGKGGLVILDMVKATPRLAGRLVDKEPTKFAPWILAEIEYTVDHDSPVHLVDVLARRLEFQWLVHPSLQPDAAKKAASLMAGKLAWNDAREAKELQDYLDYLKKNSFFHEKPLA